MRCPKCHYLSFDPEPRCRNCGYDLEVNDDDLALRNAEPADVPMLDLELRDRPSAPAAPAVLELVHSAPVVHDDMDYVHDEVNYIDVVDPQAHAEVDDVERDEGPEVDAGSEAEDRHVAVVGSRAIGLHEARLTLVEDVGANIAIDPAEPVVAQPAITPPVAEPVIAESVSVAAVVAASMAPERVEEPPREPARVPFRSRHVTTTDLPLFVKGIAAHEPIGDMDDLHTAPLPPPRPPLSVRRASEPVGARPRATARKLGPLDRDLLEDLKRVEREEAARGREEARLASVSAGTADDRVEPFRRAGAAALDVAVLGGLAAFVFWATLRLCGISLSQLELAALVPLIGFIVAMDLAYLLLFTAAGGQTVGKMLMGIRVVGDEPESGEPLSLRQAAWRAGLTVVGLGVGWLPALFGRGLTLHDRFSHTRVVRV